MKWRARAPNVTEISGYQEHYLDLCHLLRLDTPASDPTGKNYRFEMPVRKFGTGGTGRADVFRRGRFIIEYKQVGADLERAFAQMVGYQHDLGNPPLLIASDFLRWEVSTNFTGTNRKKYVIILDDLASTNKLAGGRTALELLHAALVEPHVLDPRTQREHITHEATVSIG